MKRKRTAHSAFLTVCILFGLIVFFAGILVALFAATDPRFSPGHYDTRSSGQGRSIVAPAGGVYEAWTARYNGTGNSYDEAKAIAVDNAGNVYVAGTSFGLGTSNDYATVKYDSAGQQVWVALYNDFNTPDQQLNGMTIDGSGNVYVTGGSGSNSVPSVCTTIKYNSAGQEQWIARYKTSNGAAGQAIVTND